MGAGFELSVHAPAARSIAAIVDVGEGDRDDRGHVELTRVAGNGDWTGEVPVGSRYVLLIDGERLALDPRATEVWFPPGHSRAAAAGRVDIDAFPRAMATPWPTRRPQCHSDRPLVVYEAHVRGLTARRDRADAGTFQAAIDELPRLRELGISVLELLPVHQFDPDEGNYWGYMPLVFGAIHRRYAATDDAAQELADLVAAAHELDIEVWLDVVVNHTTEENGSGPTYSLRAVAERDYYVVDEAGVYLDDAGTGNVIDAESPAAQRLIMDALDRLADLGVDGLRFDLAAVLARDAEFVRTIGDWGDQRGVRLVAEPWDMARYLLGSEFPDERWMQWNGRFRDDVRGFLRGEPGMVALIAQRVGGSLDLFASPTTSLNFVTAHDGFTMYDLVAYNDRHNEANGWDNTDGHHDNRSWNSGWEGDEDAPADVLALRRQRIRNAMCMLLLARGVPMFVAGDEFGRTQGGNNNAYNQDNETSWVDWGSAEEFGDLERFVGRLIALRAAHVADPVPPGIAFHSVSGALDNSFEARSIAWSVGGLYVMANMWWEPLDFEVQAPGEWWVALDSGESSGPRIGSRVDGPITVGPRSIVVLEM